MSKMNPKTVLITGANRGIGLEFVKQFLKLQEPPSLIFAACRSPEKAKDLQELVKKTSVVKIVKLDLNDSDTIKPLKEEVEKAVGSNGLNLLINNAGIMPQEGLRTVTSEQMMESYNVNVVGPLMISQALCPLLKKGAQTSKTSGMTCSKAAIINISSGMGSIAETSSNGFYSYRCSKAALNMMSKVLSIDLAGDGILVMSFCPGWVRTDMGGFGASTSTEQSVKGLIKVMSQLGKKDTGTFRQYNGRTISW